MGIVTAYERGIEERMGMVVITVQKILTNNEMHIELIPTINKD